MSGSLNRRGFFIRSAAGGIGACFFPGMITGNLNATEIDNKPFFEQYYNGAMNILTGLRDTQVEIINREMKIAYERMKKGGTIYSQVTAGHFPTTETALDRIGNPGVLSFLERNANEDRYSKLNPNDMIITNTINTNNIPAKERGIHVVGVSVNYYPFAETPPEEGYQIEYKGKILRIEDASSVMIYSQVPWYNGLVKPPGHFPIIPGGGLAQAAVYWMCAAQLAGLKANKGKSLDVSWSKYFINRCVERAQMVGQDRLKFKAVCKKLANLVLDGAKWWVFGADHSHALVSDACGVANGPMITRGYNASEVSKGDIVLVTAYTSNHLEEIKTARESRKKGAFVVALSPFSTDGDSSGTRLYKEVDAAFNTYSPESWGVVPVKGIKRKICPTTGVIGDLVLWLIVAEWADNMARRGEMPYFLKGYFMKNGREYNDATRPYFSQRGW